MMLYTGNARFENVFTGILLQYFFNPFIPSPFPLFHAPLAVSVPREAIVGTGAMPEQIPRSQVSGMLLDVAGQNSNTRDHSLLITLLSLEFTCTWVSDHF